MMQNISTAMAYYTAMSNKDLEALTKHLHPQVHFLTPLAELSGKEPVAKAVKNFMAFFKTLTIQTALSNENQAMIIYNVDFPGPIGEIHAAALLTFESGLISDIELFYDARPFEEKKSQIFSKQ